MSLQAQNDKIATLSCILEVLVLTRSIVNNLDMFLDSLVFSALQFFLIILFYHSCHLENKEQTVLADELQY